MTDITMPQLGESVTEGTITRWFKGVGDAIAMDEPLFEVSTDKVDSEVPSPVGGVISEIRAAEGDTVQVGQVLAVVSAEAGTPTVSAAQTPAAQTPAAQAPAAQAPAAQTPAAEAPAAEAPAPESEPQDGPAAPAAVEPKAAPAATPASTEVGPSAGTAGRLLSPVVRRLIEENGLDASGMVGTGVGGRITRNDVLALLDRNHAPAQAVPIPGVRSPAAPAPVVPVPGAAAPGSVAAPPSGPAGSARAPGTGDSREKLNNIRVRTGEHMVMSREISPHAISVVEVDFEGVERARTPAREAFKAAEGFSLTYLPFVCRAVVDALREFPHMNASVGEGELVVHHDINLSIAVDLNFQGLLAPVVRSADTKRLRAIARDINDVATRARSKRLSPDDLSGGTFTLSNSGSFGSFLVAPIINQPQVAILSTDGVRRRPVVVTDDHGNESIGIHPVGLLTMSWDHRAFDGAYAASFLARVREIIETRDWVAELA